MIWEQRQYVTLLSVHFCPVVEPGRYCLERFINIFFLRMVDLTDITRSHLFSENITPRKLQ